MTSLGGIFVFRLINDYRIRFALLCHGKFVVTLIPFHEQKGIMSGPKNPRYQGKITSWKDEQGFGFIRPNGGGPAVFAHIKSFARRGSRPAENDIVTYQLSINEKGQHRAENVAYVRDRSSRSSSSSIGTAGLSFAAAFLGVVGVSVLAGKAPFLVFGYYLAVSMLALIVYALDKSAARNNAWRTRESTLHLLGLSGGWPGALLAQRLLRHKSKKETFQVTFWLTVMLNCGAFAWLLSPSGAYMLQAISGAARP